MLALDAELGPYGVSLARGHWLPRGMPEWFVNSLTISVAKMPQTDATVRTLSEPTAFAQIMSDVRSRIFSTFGAAEADRIANGVPSYFGFRLDHRVLFPWHTIDELHQVDERQ